MTDTHTDPDFYQFKGSDTYYNLANYDGHDGSQKDCRCADDYTGPYCNLYTGKCSTGCEKCVGPLAMHCVLAVPNGHVQSNDDYESTAIGCGFGFSWTGTACVFDQDNCSKLCDGSCTDYSSRNCTACTENAFRSPIGYCECIEGYTFTLANDALDS
jgi:hypothetical protein